MCKKRLVLVLLVSALFSKVVIVSASDLSTKTEITGGFSKDLLEQWGSAQNPPMDYTPSNPPVNDTTTFPNQGNSSEQKPDTENKPSKEPSSTTKPSKEPSSTNKPSKVPSSTSKPEDTFKPSTNDTSTSPDYSDTDDTLVIPEVEKDEIEEAEVIEQKIKEEINYNDLYGDVTFAAPTRSVSKEYSHTTKVTADDSNSETDNSSEKKTNPLGFIISTVISTGSASGAFMWWKRRH